MIAPVHTAPKFPATTKTVSAATALGHCATRVGFVMSEATNRRGCSGCADRYPIFRNPTTNQLWHSLPDGSAIACEHSRVTVTPDDGPWLKIGPSFAIVAENEIIALVTPGDNCFSIQAKAPNSLGTSEIAIGVTEAQAKQTAIDTLRDLGWTLALRDHLEGALT